jgi:hypothetical protein
MSENVPEEFISAFRSTLEDKLKQLKKESIGFSNANRIEYISQGLSNFLYMSKAGKSQKLQTEMQRVYLEFTSNVLVEENVQR